MNLKCRINEKEYNIVQGATFAEEYNETLDSGSIIITHVPMIKDLRPYDDVFIWDSRYEFIGYDRNGTRKFTLNGEVVEVPHDDETIFYRHLLVNTFVENMLNIGSENLLYEYTIQLFSETKGLEVVQLPNLSITAPLKAAYKVNVLEYINRFINLYSPVYKKSVDEFRQIWEYEKKYKFSEDKEIIEIFESCYPQDFSLNNPNLKDVLSKLMITKDMIPYVKDDIIYAMDITKRKKVFGPDSSISAIKGTRTSNDHCDNLRTTYSDGITQDTTARSIEYLGFRNNDSSLMTLENMRLETRFPIYKINKVYMCYYKKVQVIQSSGKDGKKIFLCKQDITPLVKINTERNVLSEDWNKLNTVYPATIDEMSTYKMCTVGYDIGSKYVTGWGTHYKYPVKGTFWDIEKTYVENIIEKLDALNPWGIYSYTDILRKIGINEGESGKVIPYGSDFFENIVTPFTASVSISDLNIGNSLKLKSFIFEVDYQAYYSGTVYHSKDNGRDDITINDNPSSSLSVLEYDGLAKKEKINRLGNKAITIYTRYDNINQLKELGQVYQDKDNDDCIIYHREYQIWDNLINCTYYGTRDYVLKNFYTSVFAKHRTWNLIPYSESVRRTENRKIFLYLSKNEFYYEDFKNSQKSFSLNRFNDNLYKLLTCFFESKDNNDKINYGYLLYDGKRYATDFNAFCSGVSLCLNVCMNDNISSGNYISSISPEFNHDYDEVINYDSDDDIWKYVTKYLFMRDVGDDYTGSKQDWYKLVDDSNTGYVKNMGFYLSNTNDSYDDIFYNDSDIIDVNYQELLSLPLIKSNNNATNIIGGNYDIYKDNKEVLDMTYQIEPITNDNNIMFSSWFMKLNNLITNFEKRAKNETEDVSEYVSNNMVVYASNIYVGNYLVNYQPPIFLIKIEKNAFHRLNELSKNQYVKEPIDVSYSVSYVYDGDAALYDYNITSCRYDFYEITEVLGNSITVKGIRKIDKVKVLGQDYDAYNNDNITLELTKINKWNDNELPDSSDYYWFEWQDENEIEVQYGNIIV